MTKLSVNLQRILNELNNCGIDQDCIDNKTKELEKITKEIEQLQKSATTNQDIQIPRTNNQFGGQNEFPHPFESITDIWLEHIRVSLLGEDCELINKTREELLERISKVYEKEKHVKRVKWPIKISYCSEASVVIEEQGKINIPNGMFLKYKIYTKETPSWITTYEIFLDDYYFRFGDKVYYKLLESSSIAVAVSEYSGWIIDDSVDPPVTLPLDRASLLSEKDGDKVWQFGYGENEIPVYTHISPLGYNAKEEITDYMLWLHYEPTRFYPSGKPEYYVDNILGTITEKLSKQDILSALDQGSYHAYYNDSYYNGTMDITKEVTITFEPTECDSTNGAGNGAIVLSGDCTDHGGRVIASSSGFFVNNKQVAFIGDEVICKKHGLSKIIASEKVNVFSGNKQIARIGDKTECGATIIGGSKNTFTGIK